MYTFLIHVATRDLIGVQQVGDFRNLLRTPTGVHRPAVQIKHEPHDASSVTEGSGHDL